MQYQKKSIYNLAKTTFYAIFYSPHLSTCLFGDNLLSKFVDSDSELGLYNWNISSAIETLSDIFIPSLPLRTPSWTPKIIDKIFFKTDSKIISSTFYPKIKDGQYWFFLNGILSNETIVKINQKLLEKIFKRPIDIIHNASDSIIIDLFECIVGKQYGELTEPAFIAITMIIKKMLDPNITKIVAICHSQGTIVMSTVLQALTKLGFDKEERFLQKLEIYAVANCVDNMEYIIKDKKLPYLESFANTNDVVARLGCISNMNNIKIDGKIITFPKSGHLLNTHYFNNFVNEYKESQLYQYLP